MDFLILIAIFLFSVVVHEVAHGLMADYLGDPTARYAGRLTLNPLKHLDPLGSIFIPMLLLITHSPVLFGWAKPVPINTYNLRDQRYGPAKVALAGPLANLIIAFFFGLLIRLLGLIGTSFFSANLILTFSFVVQINLILAIFNLFPVPPLDGSHILFALFPQMEERTKIILYQWGILLLIFSIFFIFPIVFPLVRFLFQLLTGLSG